MFLLRIIHTIHATLWFVMFCWCLVIAHSIHNLWVIPCTRELLCQWSNIEEYWWIHHTNYKNWKDNHNKTKHKFMYIFNSISCKSFMHACTYWWVNSSDINPIRYFTRFATLAVCTVWLATEKCNCLAYMHKRFGQSLSIIRSLVPLIVQKKNSRTRFGDT